MIIYHPTYDVHHCTYRILNILYSVKDNKLSKQILKFIDFYYVYPHLLKNIDKLPRPLNYHYSKIREVNDSYEITLNPKSLYFDLAQVQDSAMVFLGYKSLISEENGYVQLNKDLIPESLIKSFDEDTFRKSDFFNVLINIFPKVNLDGKNGFKARSGLVEFRYG